MRLARPPEYSDPEDWFKAGEKIENLEERLAFYERGLREDPKWSTCAWCGIGDIHLSKNDLSKAKDALSQALQLDPNNISALLKLGLVQSAEHDYKGMMETGEGG